MKRIIAVLLVVAFMFSFAACSAKDNQKTAEPFKAGVWSVIKDDQEVATYTFTEDMKGCLYETELVGLPFDYEIDGNDYIFHMGSVDDNSKVKVAFEDENNCTLTWSDPSRDEVLKYKGESDS